MIPPDHLHVLRLIHARLALLPVDWAVTGSLGFALQGMPVAVGDIDLQTDAAGAYAIERALAGAGRVTRPVRFSGTERICSHFGALTVAGVRVEIMGGVQKRSPGGEWDEPVDVCAHRQTVEIEGLHVPVLALEYEMEAYRRLGRAEKAEQIRRWLEEH
ncbi:MAG: hypothetical protein HY784_10680 [Chloroflexi bacterium]|nr:hypothetical protein [Chloroflexota bacterium]